MKLQELRPCDECGGPVAPIFYRITIEMAAVDARAAQELVGLFTQMFGGGPAAMGLAGVMGARAGSDDAVRVAPYGRPALVCARCVGEVGKALSLCEGDDDEDEEPGGEG